MSALSILNLSAAVAADAPHSTLPLFLHTVPAGFPSPATDYQDEGLDLNTYLVRHKASSYYFTVQGDSMSGVGIMDGDKVLVDRSIEPGHNHIVVAVIDGAYTLKRLVRSATGEWALRAENPRYPVIRLRDGEELAVWGVVVGVIRKLMS
jgi:DNA polymerase V